MNQILDVCTPGAGLRGRAERILVAHLDAAVDPAVVSCTIRRATDRAGTLVEPTRLVDPGSHGTRTARILRRCAPAADLATIEVVPGGETVARLATGLRWARSVRPHVVCLALGLDGGNTALDGLVEELIDDGVLVVAAIGNDGAGRARHPALHPQVLAVGAARPDGSAAPSSGSDARPGLGLLKPDVLAEAADGTSGACALVAGLAASLWAKHPGACVGDLRAALVLTAAQLPAASRHRALRGVVDPVAADRWLATMPAGQPLPPRTVDPPGRAWVDPRLTRRLRLASPDEVVRAVVRSDTTRVVELPARRLADAIADPVTQAASATDVGTWTFASPAGGSLRSRGP